MFDNNDLLIIKQSQGWASRSISKIKSLFDPGYGAFLRDLLDKSASISKDLESAWDDFVSSKDKTKKDYDALTSISSIKITLDSIRQIIIKLIIPALLKENVEIKQKEQPTKQTKIKEVKLSDVDKKKMMDNVKGIEIKIMSTPVEPEFADIRNSILDTVRAYYFQMKEGNLSDEKFNSLYNFAIDSYDKYTNKLKMKMVASINNKQYQILIANSDIETAAGYYIIALGKYGKITTPLKEKYLDVKEFFSSDHIHNYRKNVIQAVKELLAKSEILITTVQDAISSKDNLQKWVSIIDAYNLFANEYNSKLDFFSVLYEAIRLKAKRDQMIKRKRTKKDIGKEDYLLPDFSDIGWADISSISKNRFKPAELIELEK